MTPRVKPIRGKEGRKARDAWNWKHSDKGCFVCGRKEHWLGIHTHHLIRCGRSDEPCNLFRACGDCHNLMHGAVSAGEQRITLGQQLAIKLAVTPEEWNAERLTELNRERLPQLERPLNCCRRWTPYLDAIMMAANRRIDHMEIPR